MNIRKKTFFAMDRTMINSFIHLRLTFYKNLDGTNKWVQTCDRIKHFFPSTWCSFFPISTWCRIYEPLFWIRWHTFQQKQLNSILYLCKSKDPACTRVSLSVCKRYLGSVPESSQLVWCIRGAECAEDFCNFH